MVIIPGQPVPKARARITFARPDRMWAMFKSMRPHTPKALYAFVKRCCQWYTPKKTVDAENKVFLYYRNECKEVFTKDQKIMLSVAFYTKDKRRADLSNYLKLVEDALSGEGRPIPDDHQIWCTVMRRECEPENPRTELSLSEYTISLGQGVSTH